MAEPGDVDGSLAELEREIDRNNATIDALRRQRDALKEVVVELLEGAPLTERRIAFDKLLPLAPYPFCLTPARCIGNASCKRDPCCDD